MNHGDAPRVGEEIGPYRIEGVIGTGAMGTVYGARDLRLDRQVALKVMLAAGADSDDFVRRFHRETAVLARLDSPHVIAIFDHGEHRGLPYLVTQYAAGGDLGRLLGERGPMPPALAVRVCAQVADALVAAHAVGVVHRDVKPANVLLRDDRAERLHAYLGDFGVALTEASGLTSPGAVAGTWNYLAPERAYGDPGSPATDIYSVGCLLVELLTGKPPYVGTDVDVAMEHVTSPVPQLPGSDATTVRINRVLGLTMAKLPEHRYASATALRDELRDLADSITSGFHAPAGTAAAAGRGSSYSSQGTSQGTSQGRRRVIAGVLLTVSLVVGGTVAIIAAGGADPSSVAPPAPTASDSQTLSSEEPRSPDVETEPPAILGDVDGDGRGDFVFANFDSVFVQRSNGAGFDAFVKQRGPGGTVISGDFLGSGGTDLLRIDDSVGALGLTVISSTGPRATTAVNTPVNSTDLDLDYASADVDGDGLDDVVVSTPVGRRTDLSVALSVGDGTFEDARRWYRGPLVAVDAGLAVGDFDDDGDDDLVHYHQTGEFGETSEAVLLASTGSSLEISGETLRVPRRVGDSFYSFDTIESADVDGDGTPELVCYNPYGMDALVYRRSDTRFEDQTLWTPIDPPDAGGEGIYGVTSDVDGDGRADIVTAGLSGLRVHLSTGATFRYAPSLRTKQEFPDSFDLVGRVALGNY